MFFKSSGAVSKLTRRTRELGGRRSPPAAEALLSAPAVGAAQCTERESAQEGARRRQHEGKPAAAGERAGGPTSRTDARLGRREVGGAASVPAGVSVEGKRLSSNDSTADGGAGCLSHHRGCQHGSRWCWQQVCHWCCVHGCVYGGPRLTDARTVRAGRCVVHKPPRRGGLGRGDRGDGGVDHPLLRNTRSSPVSSLQPTPANHMQRLPFNWRDSSRW